MRNLACTSLRVLNNELWILDQTQLPKHEKWILCDTLETMVEVIKSLKVRGAPLIGVSASLFFALHIKKDSSESSLRKTIDTLVKSRPTAINLSLLLKEHEELLSNHIDPEQHISLAEKHFNEDVQLCKNIANHGKRLLQNASRFITHCNTGALATAGTGTALGVIKALYNNQDDFTVYVDETRPLLQGARLTSWELNQENIPHFLICDNMAADLMRQNKIDAVIVGTDRICHNGDFANKVGTYGLAVLAHYHSIPFYVAAPITTVDKECKSGDLIPIEHRSSKEISFIHSSGESLQVAPENTIAYNPAFDVTPADLVTGYILDSGFYKPSQIADL